MKKRVLTIGILSAVAVVAILFSVSQGFFSRKANAIETYTTSEKHLSDLFVKYDKQSDTMTAEELAAWQEEVDQASEKAANALIRIQKNPEHWRDYLASTGQPYRPSPLGPIEFTGYAAKSPKEVTSDEFYDWLAARDKQMDDRSRAEMRAEGIWDEEAIERIIAKTQESRANDPEKQANREKWRQSLIEREARRAREPERAAREREVAEYEAKRAERNAWRAAEQKRMDALLSETSEMPTEAGATPDREFESFPDREFDTFESLPPLESPTVADDAAHSGEGLDTSQNPALLEDASPLPLETAFNPDAFALTFSEEMSRWESTLQDAYQDVFQLDTSFEERLPGDARQIFNQRRQRLQSEYVRRIDDVLSEIPKENRAKTLRIVRERLSETWDTDFTDAVIHQLERTDE